VSIVETGMGWVVKRPLLTIAASYYLLLGSHRKDPGSFIENGLPVGAPKPD
jgi:hypothetical protein